MSTNTTNYNLVKPDYSEAADVAVINGNMDIIDTQLKSVSNVANAAAPSLCGSQIATSFNMNDLRTQGNKVYFANLAIATNAPVNSGYAFIENISASSAGALVLQRVTLYSTGTTYVRSYANAQWYSWIKVAEAIT